MNDYEKYDLDSRDLVLWLYWCPICGRPWDEEVPEDVDEEYPSWYRCECGQKNMYADTKVTGPHHIRSSCRICLCSDENVLYCHFDPPAPCFPEITPNNWCSKLLVDPYKVAKEIKKKK